jgi:endonuclease/exonuclease/phosphatase (EEP) superfamily protein YafD
MLTLGAHFLTIGKPTRDRRVSVSKRQDTPEQVPRSGTLKVISWNLLRLSGAAVEDVAALVEQQCPDLLLMQEATAPLDALPTLVGGCFHRVPLPGRIHGLAAWSPRELPPPATLALPVSRMPGSMPPRLAQIVQIGRITLANVHLSHGQILNRRQLVCIARSLDGAAAVVGDYNAVGPVLLAGFRDVGPRRPTHVVRNVLPFRLDRCLVRGVLCAEARVLERGPSDHRPIMIELTAQQSTDICVGRPGTMRGKSVEAGIARTIKAGRKVRRLARVEMHRWGL